MSECFYFKNTGNFYLYSKPINMKSGENKLTKLCLDEMKIDPNNGDMFLFFNKACNQLKLFYFDGNGSQELIKFLPNGGFTLPVAESGQSYIKIPIKKLSLLFREPNFTIETFLDNIADMLHYFYDEGE